MTPSKNYSIGNISTISQLIHRFSATRSAHRILSRFCLSLFLFAWGAKDTKAQEFQAGLDLHYAEPREEFSAQMENPGIGIGFWGGYRFANSPVMLGLDFGFTNFGVDRREEPLSSTIPDLRVEVENKYNLVNGNLFLRLMMPSGAVRPYAEGLFGFNYFFTETIMRERGRPGSDGERLRDTNIEDVAMNYGFGGGLQLRVYRTQLENENEDSTPMSIYLNLQGRYMFGQEAEYLQSGSIRIENGDVFYDVSESETDLLYFKLGVVFGF
jgi:hypothetical protein